MKTNSQFILLVMVVCGLWGCIRERSAEIQTPQPVKYTVIEKSAAFHRKNMAFTIDSLNNKLFIRLMLNALPKEFPFPVSTKFKDTLTKTAFNFDFYSDGKLIFSDYKFLQASLQWKEERAMTGLCLGSDTLDLRSSNDVCIELPYYAFHTLKRGKQSVELHMWQDTFTGRKDISNKNGSYSSYYLSEKSRLFNAKVKFDILLPIIYKATICGQGLVLKNDSTFSPVGMDNTIWKSSYPDIYWALVYPKNTLYAQTTYETSTDHYSGLDTFSLYHYHENDSIGFHVYDHDNLSRDDFMGSWWGSLNDKDTFSQVVSFDNIKSFRFKVLKQGPLN